ncbi:hypothetical protein KKC44_06065 [Patescibacteria group bacterium]|nr:hypothetical protein [Patescibacteria group bacterium]MBU2260138.1 hypothetical protein [Patescibacteria group bacterium]
MDQVLTVLQIAAVIFLLIILYHGLFITVDLRKTMRRVNDVTRQIEDTVMKPISMADHILQWVMEYIEKDNKSSKKKSKKK